MCLVTWPVAYGCLAVLWPSLRGTRLKLSFQGLYSAPSRVDDAERSFAQLSSIRERVRACSINFQDRVVSICHLAAAHADLDIRFLAIRLAFNGHYSLRKSSVKGASSRSTRG